MTDTTREGHVSVHIVEDEMANIPGELNMGRQLSEDKMVADVQKQLIKLSEVQNNVESLVAMGFERDIAQIALIYTDTIDSALEYLTADKAVDKHNFIRGDREDLCAICFLNLSLHTSAVVKGFEEEEKQAVIRNFAAERQVVKPVEVKENKDDERLCTICFCPVESEDQLAVLSCSHFFCRECISRWIESRTNDGKIAGKFIFCPNDACRSPFEDAEIQKFASEETLAKYQRIQTNHLVERNPNARWCPNPKCSKPVYRKGTVGCGCCGCTSSGTSECEHCGTQCCFECGNPPHGRFQSCPKIADENMINWAGDDVSKCPKCKVIILRTDGCNHMTCNCGHEFCWVCGGDYSKIHFQPLNPFGCPGMHGASSLGSFLIPCTRTPIGRFFFRLMMIFVVLVGVPIWIVLQFALCPLWCVFWLVLSPRLICEWWCETFWRWFDSSDGPVMYCAFWPILCCMCTYGECQN
jgi:hypothetical protein